MAASTPTCGICDLRHLNNLSVVWCAECNEGLCGDCKEHHGLVKASRNHKTVPVEEYMKLPTDAFSIENYCSQHNEKFQTYCQKHNCPCCRICMVQDHDGCTKVPLEDIVHDVKNSNKFTETYFFIDKILETMNDICNDLKSNVDSFTQQKQKVEQKIQETRVKVNDHLDKLEEALKKELDTAEASIIAKSNQLTASLDQQKKEVVGYKSTLTNLNKYASDLQTFFILNQIQNDIITKEQYLHSLVENGNLNGNHVSFKTNSMIDDVILGIQQFGEVIIDSRPPKENVSNMKDKQTQMKAVSIPPKSIYNIRATLRQIINTKLSEVTGCVFLPNDTMAFTCYRQNVVRIIYKDGSKLSDITTGTDTFDVVYIEDSNSIAVTSGGNGKQCITMIDNGSKQIKATFPVKSYSAGITAGIDALYFSAWNKGLRMVNLRDSSVRDFAALPMAVYAYVTTFCNNIYYTNNENNTVTCCDLQGNRKWEFKDKGILKSPLGIDVDRVGNIYVVGYGTHNVVVISPDGKQYKQLLSKTDGLKGPRVLNFDKTASKLLVANRTGNSVLFSISY